MEIDLACQVNLECMSRNICYMLGSCYELQIHGLGHETHILKCKAMLQGFFEPFFFWKFTMVPIKYINFPSETSIYYFPFV